MEQSQDAKPYGVKTQWHLMPFRQLLRVNQGSRTIQALANYQDDPCSSTCADLYGRARVEYYKKGDWEANFDELVVRVMEHGNTKYGPNNWKNATSKDEYLSAYCRHMFADEKLDPESGLPHKAHAACNALFLMWMYDNE